MLISNILIITSVILSILTLTNNNPVNSILFMISLFVSTSLFLCSIDIVYIGLVYLIVYVGAIAMLFLFIVMLLNIREYNNTISSYKGSIPLAGIIGFVIFYIVGYSTSYSSTITNYSTPGDISFLDQITSVGYLLYTDNILLFIITAVLLLISRIGPLMLCIED